ncbi:TPA: FKLRK protein [Staphylococcus aureus]|uniref:Gram-positive signal peptide, ysirk family protein n=4 Tax=Staphylococcus aureus TaxID=1280 RepID=A0A2S6DRG4_STAAU|nr:FKLRK protein [Staphylococcus aureus]HDH6210796.1 FKLRK protein [Staphylococcus aureus LTCF-12-55]HDH6225351.1 FKLRK protein [Staphylococcus aureus LTCF-12-46]HDH6264451.1 FKLRK protein [Staphylococcus aureus LTCF-7-30]HDH6421707.1 FKLRK protein [Staphylococcus aureus MRSA-Lux-33]HDH6424026.1 FKLRK protein [Staphylococcus aureus MRSA-Lux-34]HDH6427009.1 FKLRK protein [Staphylococcus aureus MRSA-Lux-32]HDH6429685.1 FKLRK protein [Staphylococcus aureus MRSA-Lux-31]HDX9042321.1 FKLRK protei
MRENFKLRKMKVGLVSVAITMLYIMTNGQAEASEANEKPSTNQESKVVSQTEQNSKETKTVESNKNFVKLDTIKPGAQKVTGTTLPNHYVLLTVDGKSADSVENGGLGFVEANDKGEFEYPLNNRKIVHNQEIEVSSSSPDLGEDEEDEEVEEASTDKAGAEEESTEAKATYTTPRYENAYKVPEKQLDKKNGHHQVLIEPITEGSGIIKGHTSVKGKVALSINNKFINFETNANGGPNKEEAKSGSEGIWMPIDDKGYFNFDFKTKRFDDLELKKDNEISLTFAPDDEDEALKSLIFKTKVTSLEDIDKAETKYDHTKVNKVKVLKDVKEDLHVDEIYGSLYHTEKGKGILDKEGTKVIKGKTKFANAVVKVDSELGESQLFPDLQVDEKGEFSFDVDHAGFRLQNGETLNFTVVDPITGKLLSEKFVSKNIDIYESPEEKADREFDERMENTPAYHKLHGDKIVGYDTNGFPITWFYPLGEKKVERKAPKLEK